eukprot:CAMPEP_0197824222 /NCGR_PEP_ID=MMETSP1437-20131217/1507_1 /TAXON_ID=49252 ORGANISM="Eucampia antarctica, Strain CCMP1452" /NCGR_SAMPLE_ID=MMETSP1437 /ASSEMBLY_ACC=CAM_ASM_001096 /LENGTH=187 /DNA_ID=CAMNT_0043423765 /DNA_START=125 /DNA_END=688 /DNA_ORIENTATION=-
MMQGMMPGGKNVNPETTIQSAKLVDLSTKFDKVKCYARNESSQYPMTNLFIGDSRLGCKSDADEQLIIHMEFNEFVKVHSIKLTEFNRGANPEELPTKVHIYVNRNNMGFEDTEDLDPTQSFELTAGDLKEDADPICLKFVKFQRVRSITLFVEDNAGGDVSALGGLQVFGKNVATTNMNEFKKQEG